MCAAATLLIVKTETKDSEISSWHLCWHGVSGVSHPVVLQ